MERIDIKKAQAIAKNKGLKPGKVKGTDGVQFTKGKNDRLDVITWEEFEGILAKRKLAISGSLQGYPSLAKGDRFRAYSRRSSRVQIPSLAPLFQS